jgi:hypothetical protein
MMVDHIKTKLKKKTSKVGRGARGGLGLGWIKECVWGGIGSQGWKAFSLSHTHTHTCTPQVTILLEAGQGGVSGGTIASAMNIAKTTPRAELMKVSSDAYYLAEAAGG